LTYEVSVVNKFQGCADASFSLTKSCPTGWTCSLDAPTLIIPSAHSSITHLKISPPANTSKGEYPFSVTATTISGGTTYSGMGTAVYQITNSPPIAAISCEPTNCTAYTGHLLTFINKSTDPDGIDDINKSEWDIENWGPSPDIFCVLVPPDLASALCSFTPSGLEANNYNLRLKVTDKDGASDIAGPLSFTILQDAVADFDCSLNLSGVW